MLKNLNNFVPVLLVSKPRDAGFLQSPIQVIVERPWIRGGFLVRLGCIGGGQRFQNCAECRLLGCQLRKGLLIRVGKRRRAGDRLLQIRGPLVQVHLQRSQQDNLG